MIRQNYTIDFMPNLTRMTGQNKAIPSNDSSIFPRFKEMLDYAVSKPPVNDYEYYKNDASVKTQKNKSSFNRSNEKIRAYRDLDTAVKTGNAREDGKVAGSTGSDDEAKAIAFLIFPDIILCSGVIISFITLLILARISIAGY